MTTLERNAGAAKPPPDPSAATEARLLEAAHAARARAYAPYSRFAVGAAVLDSDGNIHIGCNVENAAYPLGTCAEAGALAAMIVAGGRKATLVAVVAEAETAVLPCGGCRQKLRELGGDDLLVIAADRSGVRARHSLAELLPHSFGPEQLRR